MIIVALLMKGFIDKIIMLILTLLGILLSFLCKGFNIPLVSWLLTKFGRGEELNRFPGKGIVFYFAGCTLSLYIFSLEIALASIMVLALGDSISHLYGLHFGRIRHPLSNTKFLEGSLAGLLAGFIGAKIFLPWHEAFFASFAAMAAEAIEIKIGAEQIDDNLLIPVIAGATVWLFRFLSSII